MRAGSTFTGQGEADKCTTQSLRLLRIIVQRLKYIRLVGLQGRQQTDARHLQLEQLVNIQSGRVTHYIGREIGPQYMATQLSKRRQCSGLHIQIGAACIGVDRLERMCDGLDLLHTLGRTLQPGVSLVLRDQFRTLGIFIGLELVELGFQAFLKKRIYRCTKA